MIETIAMIAAFSAFAAFSFWLSAKPERMKWMWTPSDPEIQRLVTRGAAWIALFFIGLILISLLLQLIFIKIDTHSGRRRCVSRVKLSPGFGASFHGYAATHCGEACLLPNLTGGRDLSEAVGRRAAEEHAVPLGGRAGPSS